jgi:hypothetical protein
MRPVKSSLPGSGFPLQIGNGLAAGKLFFLYVAAASYYPIDTHCRFSYTPSVKKLS